MIKDAFTLNKNSWHMKLMSYIWGFKYYDFSHLCPYFWLSFLNLIIIIPIFLVKNVIFWPIVTMVVYLTDLNYDHKREKARQLLDRLIEDPKYREKLAGKCYRDWRKMYDKFYSYNLIYQDKYSAIIHQIEKMRDDNWQAALKGKTSSIPNIDLDEMRRKRRQAITKITKAFKPAGKALAVIITIALILGVFYLLCKLVVLLSGISHKGWMRFWLGVGRIVLAIAIVTALVFLVSGISKAISRLSCQTRDILATSFIIMFKPFKYIGLGIGRLFVIIFAMVKDNCPAIHWDK